MACIYVCVSVNCRDSFGTLHSGHRHELIIKPLPTCSQGVSSRGNKKHFLFIFNSMNNFSGYFSSCTSLCIFLSRIGFGMRIHCERFWDPPRQRVFHPALFSSMSLFGPDLRSYEIITSRFIFWKMLATSMLQIPESAKKAHCFPFKPCIRWCTLPFPYVARTSDCRLNMKHLIPTTPKSISYWTEEFSWKS